jgi:hypothetical protein
MRTMTYRMTPRSSCWLGADKLEEAISGKRPTRGVPVNAREAPEPVGAYLQSLTVEGFRGIRPPATLKLRSGGTEAPLIL